MIRADVRQAQRLAGKLKTVNRQAIPYATRQTVNDNAFAARTFAIRNIERKFTLRNKWTTRRVNVERATSLRIREQEAAVGSPEEYLARQEYGGLNESPVPTTAAAGQGVTASRRTRPVAKRNRTPNLHASKQARGGTLAARIGTALAAKERVILVGRGEPARAGVYRLQGGTAKRPERAKLVMIQAHGAAPKRTAASPWLRPAALRAARDGYKRYARALDFQLKRLSR